MFARKKKRTKRKQYTHSSYVKKKNTLDAVAERASNVASECALKNWYVLTCHITES